MRISDWSADVCSSDLAGSTRRTSICVRSTISKRYAPNVAGRFSIAACSIITIAPDPRIASPRTCSVKWRCICCKHPADPASDRRAGLSQQFGYAPILVLPQRRNPAMKARTERRVALVAAMKQIERHFELTHFDDHMPHPATEKIPEAARAFGIHERDTEQRTEFPSPSPKLK